MIITILLFQENFKFAKIKNDKLSGNKNIQYKKNSNVFKKFSR